MVMKRILNKWTIFVIIVVIAGVAAFSYLYNPGTKPDYNNPNFKSYAQRARLCLRVGGESATTQQLYKSWLQANRPSNYEEPC